jgi:hypothetical protein
MDLSRKISLALVLMALAGVASASNGGCPINTHPVQFLWWVICVANSSPPPTVLAPEIDPGSIMAGLTMLAGSLAVLRGRWRANQTAN